MNLLNYKGMIFDLDGTILDSLSVWKEVDIKYLARYGYEYKEKYSEDIKSMTHKECALYFKNTFNINKSLDEIINDWHEMVEIEYRDHIQLKSGVLAYLKHLKENNIKMCIATSCDLNHARMALKRLKVDTYFDFILTCQSIGKNKKNPDIYIECANKMNLDISECIVHEDIYDALNTAKKAGFTTVGIKDDFNIENIEKVSDYCITSFYELMK